MDAAVNTQFSYARLYKLKDGLLTPAPNYDKTVVAAGLILKAHQIWGLPEIDIVINQTDGVKGVSSTTKRGPILTIAKDKTIDGIVLLYIFDVFNEGVPHEDVQNDTIPWEKKREQMICRGVPSDAIDAWGVCRYNEVNWIEFTRGKLVDLSIKNPELIDARFSGYSWHTSDYMKAFFTKINVMSEHLSKTDQVKYKYQISPDGNVSTYPGIQWRLFSGSILFKIESNHVQWFEAGLKPFVHYIPVKKDLSDLIEKIKWAQKNDAEAKRIAENAKKFAQNYINYEMNLKYVYLTLLRYALLYKK